MAKSPKMGTLDYPHATISLIAICKSYPCSDLFATLKVGIGGVLVPGYVCVVTGVLNKKSCGIY